MLKRLVTVLLAFAAAASLFGCGVDRLQAVATDLRADPEALRFAPTFIGHPTQRFIQLTNAARTDQVLAVEIAAPFRIVEAPGVLRAGERLALTVAFDPTEVGAHEALLRIEASGAELTVALSGQSLAPPTCASNDPCRASRFDADSGVCVEGNAENGTACADACITEGVCRAGNCVGVAMSCDDGNACTRDVCDRESGCLNLDTSSACAEPTDPCKVPLCDPSSGCGAADAVDGTACGEADCDSARVCLAGTCKTVAVPEGASCAPASPCQARGTCRSKVCERPDPVALTPAWTRTPTEGKAVIFPGVVDASDAVYWLECGVDCDLVSVTRDGYARFRTPLGGGRPEAERVRGTLVLSGSLALVAPGKNQVHGIRAADGQRMWTRDLLAEIAPVILEPESSAWAEVGPLVTGASGEAYLLATVFVRTGTKVTQQPGWVIALDAMSGSLRWKKQLQGSVHGLLADEQGALHLYFRPLQQEGGGGAQPALVSFSSTGAQRFSSSTVFGVPLATYAGNVVQVGAGLADASGGAGRSVSTTCYGGLYAGGQLVSPLLAPGAGYLFGMNDECFAEEFIGDSVELCRFDPATGQQTWSARLMWAQALNTSSPSPVATISQPTLTSDGAIVVAGGVSSAAPWHLNAFSSSGKPLFACELPSGTTWAAATVLLSGRWVGVRSIDGLLETREVVAFDVPSLKPAPAGWTAMGGSANGAGRPLP